MSYTYTYINSIQKKPDEKQQSLVGSTSDVVQINATKSVISDRGQGLLRCNHSTHAATYVFTSCGHQHRA